MLYSLPELLWLFLIYAFLGWCMEVIYAAVTKGHFVNRGVAFGPVCPIYAFGVLLVVICLTPLEDYPYLLFVGAVILTSLLELITGYALEKKFNDKWWDYSERPFNFKGYICLEFSLMWGLACLLVFYIVHPSILWLVRHLCNLPGYIVLAVLWCIFLTDEVLTFIELHKFSKRLRALDDIEAKIRGLSDGIGGRLADGVLDAMDTPQIHNLSERWQQDQERFARKKEELVSKRARFHEHFIKAYPQLQNGRHASAIRQIIEQARKKKRGDAQD